MPRHWREITADMSRNKDHQERLAQLVRELEDALIAEDPEGRETLRVDGRIIVKGEEPSQ
jgi:hypothetical protein